MKVRPCFHFIPDGDLQGLDQQITKRSPTLDRDAVYSHHSRLERLPTYLTVHMVRFAWKSDIGKKAKIMVRKFQSTCGYGADLWWFTSVK